jgi:hypothetical protein
MEACNGVSTPIEPNLQLLNNESEATPENRLLYQQAIGKIIYAMLGTRPDLAFTVSVLSSFCSNPSPKHAIAVQRVFRYLRKTADTGITYSGTQEPSNSLGYTDSDWAGNLDSRKSTSGYVFILFGGATSWKSSRQSIVAMSSTEAEYIACSEAAKEALWLQRLLGEIQRTPIRKAQTLFADNQGAIKLSKNPQQHKRTKHIDIKYHFIRDCCQKGLVELVYLPTGQMVADILTKSLPREKHELHAKGMGLEQLVLV